MPLAIQPATEADLADTLPLFAEYQRFYENEQPDDERNRAFLTRFLAPSDTGLLLLARDETGAAIGFANLYWTFESVAATEHALMNDLFVVDTARGDGVGNALIEAAKAAAKERGLPTFSWVTALDNRTAQRLYERTGADRSAWFEYALEL